MFSAMTDAQPCLRCVRLSREIEELKEQNRMLSLSKSPSNVKVMFDFHMSTAELFWHRTRVLILLMLLQSVSSTIMHSYESLVASHNVIAFFLTMLVGAGGNAGNQAAVHTITGIAVGELRLHHTKKRALEEFRVGLLSALTMGIVAYFRVILMSLSDTTGDTFGAASAGLYAFSVAAACMVIVLTSVVIGASLPFVLLYFSLDVEHAAPTIQVIMDVLGVFVTLAIASLVLPAAPPVGK